MINVDLIYQSIRNLSTKGKGGYTTSNEFNSDSKRAELLLWQYYSEQYERSREVPEAMYPFLVKANLALAVDGLVSLPADYGHFVLVNYARILSVPGQEPMVNEYNCNYLAKEEEGNTLESAVRGPSFDKRRFYYGFYPGNKIKIFPTGITGQARLQYLRYPTYAVRGYTVDATNDEQVYNPGTSTQYEWPAQEENNIIDLLLLAKGLETRDSEIVRWAASRSQTSKTMLT